MTKDSLFDKKDLYEMSCEESGLIRLSGLSPYRQRKLRVSKMHLINEMQFTETNGFAIVQPYTDLTEFTLCPFTKRNKHNGKNEALHFFLDDIAFAYALTYRFEQTTYQLRKFDYIFGPDHSMYVGAPVFMNKEAVWNNRFATAYWQSIGYKVIPTASWGDVDTFKYCFEGLPQNSVIAVCGVGHNQNSTHRTLWQWAIQELEAQLNPTIILVYGAEEDVPGIQTPIKFYPDFINTQLRHVK